MHLLSRGGCIRLSLLLFRRGGVMHLLKRVARIHNQMLWRLYSFKFASVHV